MLHVIYGRDKSFLYLKFGHRVINRKKRDFGDFLPVRDKQRVTMRMTIFG